MEGQKSNHNFSPENGKSNMDTIISDNVNENLYNRGEKAVHSKENNGKPKGLLFKLLKPTLVFLTLSGCYRFRNNIGNNNSSETYRNTSKWKILGLIYRILCFLLCIIFCVKGSAAIKIEKTKSLMNFQILFLLWYFQCTFIFLIFLKADSRFGHLVKAMQFWDCKISPAMEHLQIDLNEEKVRKWQNIYIIIGVVITLVNIVCLGIICSPVFSDDNRDQYVAPFQYSAALLILVLVLAIPLTLLWVFPVFSVMTISTLLTTAFEAYNNFLEKYLSNTLQSKTCKLHQLRLLHLNLCKMVTHLDSDLGYYYASSFVFNVGISCYILYQVIKIPMSIMNQSVFLVWLASHLGFLSAMSVVAARVNQAVSP